MAAPADLLRYSFQFRDAKGQTGKMRLLIGDATVAAINTDANNAVTLLQACSNAFVQRVDISAVSHAYGAASTYLDVEDKASLTFLDQQGSLHRYEVPAIKSVSFQADQETVNAAETNMSALIAFFASFVYGHQTDTSPLTYVGGIRRRRRFQRRFNIFTKDPTLAGEGE